MKAETFDMMRVWAALTGLALAIWYFAALYFGFRVSDPLPMLVTAIGGFEMFLFGQDVWLKKKRSKHG
jgi:hypothetical protein